MMTFVFVDALNWDLQCVVQLFNKDAYFGRHTVRMVSGGSIISMYVAYSFTDELNQLPGSAYLLTRRTRAL